tara:strand:+ start:358 stop:525 length:168 start_codon:yes stop_codon:yes gene_type:complete
VLVLVTLAVVQTTQDVVATGIHLPLDHIAQHLADMVPTVVNNMLAVLVAMDLVVT